MNTNILVTSYITQESPSQKWGGDPTSLTEASYKQILKMLTDSGEKHFNLIGGEPTAHYDFKSILELTNLWCKENQLTATLFTNGSYLEPFISSIGSSINLVIQFAALEDFIQIEQYTTIINTLEHLDNLGWFNSKKAVCQFEINPNSQSFEYIENLLTTFKFSKIRINFPPISLIAPPEEYYSQLKQKFLELCNTAYQYHTMIEVDSYNAVPYCYFSDSEKALISLVCTDYPRYSTAFRLVIFPNLDCIYDRYNNINQAIKANLKDFSTLQELNKYLLLAVYYPLTSQKCEGRCAVCPQADLYKCDGRYLFKPDAKIKEDELNG